MNKGGNNSRDGGREGGREGGRRKGGSKGMVGREGTRGGEEGREGESKGREDAVMIGRQRASVEEWRVDRGRVDEVVERGRDDAWMAGGRKRTEEGLSEKEREGNF